MGFVEILLALVFVFALALAASVVLTRLSKPERVKSATVAELAEGSRRPGDLYQVEGDVMLMDFESLDAPSALVLADGDARLQLADSDALLEGRGTERARLFPAQASSLVGRETRIGRYKLAGTYEEVPIRHLRIRALHEVAL